MHVPTVARGALATRRITSPHTIKTRPDFRGFGLGNLFLLALKNAVTPTKGAASGTAI